VQGVAIRSMKAPGTAYNDPVLGKDPQPAHMRDYVDTIQDSGGVHINSGIPNHAFYLAAVTLPEYYAWDCLGHIWYETLTARDRTGRRLLRRAAQFQDFARLTAATAEQLYPPSTSRQALAVRSAWAAVGITV
jgi:Zn-dependent metalloprotease